MSDLYVDSFCFRLGDRKVHVSESEAAGRLISSAEDLESAGFGWHYMSEPEATAYDIAKGTVDQLAAASKLEEIDAIVYATCLPINGSVGADSDYQASRDVKYLMDYPASRLQADYELGDAVVIGLNQQACTSMLGSIRLAKAMLAAEPDWRKVLCVTADRFPDGAIYEQAYNLISDGGAACIVGRERSGFRVLDVHQITNGGLGLASDDEAVGSFFGYTIRLVKEAFTRTGLTAADIDWVITQNTNDKAWTILGRMLGIEQAKVWGPTIGDVGHVISGDNVVNLSALLESGKLEPGHKLLLVMAGFGLNWQCAILEAV